jgi:hypothetical protein
LQDGQRTLQEGQRTLQEGQRTAERILLLLTVS